MEKDIGHEITRLNTGLWEPEVRRVCGEVSFIIDAVYSKRAQTPAPRLFGFLLW
jgi:hypothetical protein